MEVIGEAVTVSEEKMCNELVEERVVDECWKQLEFARIIREIMAGDTSLKMKIERGLRDTREMVEAVEAILTEEAASTRRLEKVERLKIAWKKRMEIKQYELMLKKLSELTLLELEEDMEDIERLVLDMIIKESGETNVKMDTKQEDMVIEY